MNELQEKLNIENMIYEIRGKQVMLDSDLARLYQVETKYLNRQVKRNISRFPESYCFQLSDDELKILRCQSVTSNKNQGGRRYLPYVFTEHGITMLSSVLKSEIAVTVSLKIVDTFISMRKYISNNLLEQKYINNQVMKNTEDIKLLQESFKKFEENKKVNEIYFNGQIYDAYSKILDIFKMAKENITIIDSYSDKETLDIIRNIKLPVTIITKENGPLKEKDILKYNEQYNNLKIIYNNTFHDRYFILDNKTIYHCGTSLNRIGTKTFSINLLEDEVVIKSLLDKLASITNKISNK